MDASTVESTNSLLIFSLAFIGFIGFIGAGTVISKLLDKNEHLEAEIKQLKGGGDIEVFRKA